MSRLYSKLAENLMKGNINDLSSSGTTTKCALLANTIQNTLTGWWG